MTDFTPVSGLLGGALIGASASLLLFSHGRVVGISGILAGLASRDFAWRMVFIVGMMIGALVIFPAGTNLPQLSDSSPLKLAVAGLLVGFGTRLGSGCTSGHGVCGLARFSVRSLAAVMVFMGAAGVTVLIIRHGFGV
ncbi:MAG: YeeE/YedE family protein [Endozoicomonas sp.]